MYVCTGSQGEVKLTISSSALEFAVALAWDGLKVSVKLTVIVSEAKIGKGLVRTLAGQGLQLKYAASVRDLGVDNAAGMGRRKLVIRARFLSGGLRHKRVLTLRKHAGNKAGKKLFNAGTMPATVYGLIAHGPAPKRLRPGALTPRALAAGSMPRPARSATRSRLPGSSCARSSPCFTPVTPSASRTTRARG